MSFDTWTEYFFLSSSDDYCACSAGPGNGGDRSLERWGCGLIRPVEVGPSGLMASMVTPFGQPYSCRLSAQSTAKPVAVDRSTTALWYGTVSKSGRLRDWSVYRAARGQILAGKFSGLLSGSWAVPADGSRVCPGVGCGSRGEARWSFGVRRPGSVYGTHVRSLFRFLFSDHLLDPLGGVGRGGVRQRPRGVGLTRTHLRWS